ncbi:MAG: alcohol dehydrogenase [Geminicoccaceae bacterium]|nr:MAG: alcohol dehydrogenase [Geminicoccaceae bacterium]
MPDALYLHAAHDARLGPAPALSNRPDGVRLDIAAVGLCGSDLHYYKDGGIGSATIAEPFVPGHEFAGWLTDDVPELGLGAGALVAVDPNAACGQCAWCHEGHPNLCPHVQFIGAPPFHGAMTPHLVVPRRQIVPLPEGFSPLEAVMLEPLGVAIHAVDLAKPRLLERVALLGCGPIGLLILEVLKVAGAGEIVAIDPQPHRRAAAAQAGATATGADLAVLADLTKGEGCPLVVEATNAPLGFRDAVRAARIGGRVVLVGIPDGDTYTLPAAEARRRGLKIKFARRMGEVYPRAIELVRSGKVDVTSMVTAEVGLDEAPELFRRHAADEPGLIKSLIYPNGQKRKGD